MLNRVNFKYFRVGFFSKSLQITNIFHNFASRKVIHQKIQSNMLQSEFTQRTKINVTAYMFAQIHEDYMKSSLDKDAFCAQWKRKNSESATQDLVDQIQSLRQQLAEEKQKREAEREHAQKELLDALHTKSAFEDELIRIFDIEGDHRAIHAMEQRVITKYYQK